MRYEAHAICYVQSRCLPANCDINHDLQSKLKEAKGYMYRKERSFITKEAFWNSARQKTRKRQNENNERGRNDEARHARTARSGVGRCAL